MKKYIRIMRIDHWIKQMFIVPGCCIAFLLTHTDINLSTFVKFIIGFLGTSFIASANYVINEWLDAEFDRFHPTKKNRSVVTEDVKGSIVWILWAVLTIVGFVTAKFVNNAFLAMCIWLWIMGILYNVKPIRTKDVPYLDVLSESVNNAIRLLMGWFIVTDIAIPPSSVIMGYWMTGAFLMAIKRFAEYRMIDNPEVAGSYRKSFKFYSLNSLLNSAFFYAMASVFFLGIFLIKYRIEYLLAMPVLIGLYCYYFWISFKDDSAVQKPEKLYKEKGLMVYVGILIVLFIILTFIDIPRLSILQLEDLIEL